VIARDLARTWITRWDRQQESYLADREDRFTALIDAVEAGAGRPDPLVLDLGCGPGSLATRLLDRLPKASVVAVDTDPLLLALGEAANADRPGLRFVDHDLGEPGWAATLGLGRQADAAVSTTALHWLSEQRLRTAYAELATVLRPGALFLNGDHLNVTDTAPTLSALEHKITDRATRRRFGDTPPEDWSGWWEAIAQEPELAHLATATKAGSGHHGAPSGMLSAHLRALRDSGFTETGTLWQHGNDRLLCAIRA
jgi:SAM-dependent methyltransferase